MILQRRSRRRAKNSQRAPRSPRRRRTRSHSLSRMRRALSLSSRMRSTQAQRPFSRSARVLTHPLAVWRGCRACADRNAVRLSRCTGSRPQHRENPVRREECLRFGENRRQARRTLEGNWHDRRDDLWHRRADEPPRAQCGHRGGACWRARPRLCCRRR